MCITQHVFIKEIIHSFSQLMQIYMLLYSNNIDSKGLKYRQQTMNI